ncbi:MAG TPA: TIGR00730 family Rossman fold protein [Planctomycetes bacterium]|nr:TIGR00730 family Rossman fold protein [Planctomycetota bacterium]
MSEHRFRAVKAYENLEFLRSRDARALRILSEYMEPQARFRELRIRDTIVMFGSARILPRDEAAAALEKAREEGGDVERAKKALEMSRFYEAARELASRLTTWSKGLEGTDRRFVICSGGGPGIMEAANRGASEAKGENIGLNISLPFEQMENPYITHRLGFEFHYFFMRKYWFAYMAKAFVIMPGGFGTLDELMEIMTLIQTEKIRRKVALVLYGRDYWDKVLNLDALVEAGTISPEDIHLFHTSDSVEEAYEYLTNWLQENILSQDEDDESDYFA